MSYPRHEPPRSGEVSVQIEMHETPAARNDIDGTLPKHKMQDVSQAELRDAHRKQVMVIL